MYAPWLRSATLSMCLTTLLAAGGCAHDQASEADAARDREVEVLNSRVSRLERRISDMDAKLTLLTDRLEANRPAPADDDGPARHAMELDPDYGPTQPTPGYAETPSPATEPEPVPARDAEPDFAAANEDYAFDAPGEGAADADAEPLVIDDKALARFSLKARKPQRSAPRRQARRAPTAQARADRAANGMPRKGPKAIYKWGLAKLRSGDCGAAFGAFDAVLERYPRHGLADNALYWVGVCHQSTGAHVSALEVWGSLPARFPKSPKIPDALFGMAESHRALGDSAAAKMLYHQLLERFPGAEKADAARASLKALESAS